MFFEPGESRFIREFGNNAFDVDVVERAAQGNREALELMFEQISKEDRVLSYEAYEILREHSLEELRQQVQRALGRSKQDDLGREDTNQEDSHRVELPLLLDLGGGMERASHPLGNRTSEEMVERPVQRLKQDDLGREDTNQEGSNKVDIPDGFSFRSFLTPGQLASHPLGNRTCQEWIRYAVLDNEWRRKFKDCFTVDFGNLPHKHPARKHERLLCFVFEDDPDTALAARESVFLPLEGKKVNLLFAWAKKQRPFTPSTREYPSTVKRGKTPKPRQETEKKDRRATSPEEGSYIWGAKQIAEHLGIKKRWLRDRLEAISGNTRLVNAAADDFGLMKIGQEWRYEPMDRMTEQRRDPKKLVQWLSDVKPSR
jgi:hypothetical protein